MEHKKLSSWDRVQICRHPNRPQARDYIFHICDDFEECRGDRTFRDDRSIVSGCGYFGEEKCIFIGQEKGKEAESRLRHNFGMPLPEGYRKALRMMKLAEKFRIPVVTLIDTPGSYPGIEAEERGQSMAIATNLLEMFRIRTPIICILIGEGCSGGALGIGIGDVFGMLKHAYYSVISPEGCAAILWADWKMRERAAEALRMHAEDLLAWGIIDEILSEPNDGAHTNPSVGYSSIKSFIHRQLHNFSTYAIEELLKKRWQRFRKMGLHHKS